jgi:hypothetical protein
VVKKGRFSAVTKLLLSADADSVCSTLAFPACPRYAGGAEFSPVIVEKLVLQTECRDPSLAGLRVAKACAS